MNKFKHSLKKQIFVASIYFILMMHPFFISGQTPALFYVYDNMNRLINITSQDGSHVNYSYDAVGNRVSQQITYIRPVIRDLQNMTIENGQSKCFEATQTLRLAGNGTTFVVQNGGSVTLVAGQNISFEPGVTVYQGGYLHGYITTNDIYCGTMLNPLVANLVDEQTLGVETVVKNKFIKVYPNPTTDIVIVELLDAGSTATANVTVYTMNGGKLYQKDFKGESKFQFSLAGKPVGIYLVHVQSGDRSEIAKVVKN